MELPAADLSRITDLYAQGMYLQAYRAGVSTAPLNEWTGTAARLLAGRLARQLGAPRLSRWQLIKAYRGQPTHPEAIYYHARYFLEKHNLLAAWRFLRNEKGVVDDAAPDLRADLFSLQAFLSARLRDFEKADAWIKRALELAPDRPWLYVEKSSCLEFAERFEEALEAARHSMTLRPLFRPAVQAAGHLLLLLDRDKEALDLLTEASEKLECAAVASQLAALQDELGMHEDSRRSYDRFAELSPLIEDEVAQWLAARRSDIHYDLGDIESARKFAAQAGEGFHQTVAERLAHVAPDAKRVVLENVARLPRPLPQTIPAALMILRRYWQPGAVPPPDDPFRLDAPLEYQERRWAEQEGWVVREFTATQKSLYALIDAGVPSAISVVEATFAQLQAIAGYDERKGILLFRDPTERHLGEMMLEPLLERFKSNGPRVIAMLPPGEAHRLDGIELPDAPLYEIVYRMHRAMEIFDRDAAGKALAEMQALAPDHRLTLHSRYILGRYDAHNPEQLAALDELLKRFPDDPTFLLARVTVLRELDRREERLSLLKRLSSQPSADLVFAQHYAQELASDAREQQTAERLLCKVIENRPNLAAPYYHLASMLWDQQRKDEALELFRFSACLDDASDGLARHYVRSARAMNRTDEAVRMLEDRVARFGEKSSQHARILFNSLSDLDRVDDAFAVLDRALAKRKTDGELLLFAAEMRAAYGEIKTAQSLLKAAKDKARPTAWLRAAANLAGMQGNLHEALGYWREVSAAEPLSMDAHRAIALRLAETEGRNAALEYLKGLTERHARHYGLLQLRIEWLRLEGPAAAEPVVRKLIEYHPSDAWAHRELALHLAELKRYGEAEVEMETAARLEPPSPSYHCVLGRVYSLAGRTEEAREQYRAALRLSIDNDLAISELMNLAAGRAERRDEIEFIEQELARQPHLGEGVIAFFGHAIHTLEPHEVHKALQEMLDARPDLWQTWSTMVQQLLSMERFPEARSLAEHAIDRFPMLPRLWLDRADVCAATGDEDGQIEMLRQALRISPGWGPAMRELAEALDRRGRLEEAVELLKQAVTRSPLDPASRGLYADKLWKIGQSQAALEQAKEALKLDPGFDMAWRMLGLWCERMEQPEQVTQFAREQTQRRPGDIRTWLALVRQLNNPAESEEVLAALDRVLTLSPRNPEARDLKAERLCDLGRFDEAREVCRPAPGEDAAPMILQGRGAWVEARAGNYDRAIDLMEKIVESEPNYFWGWQQLTDWYHETARLEDYLRAASRLVELRPDNPIALTRRGEAQLLNGEREAGKSDLRQAQQIAPDYPMPGMLLFDEYMADDELESAAATLAILQEHVADDFVIARNVQLAARQGDKTTALDAFRNLCESPIEASWPVTSARAALRNADWGDEADKILKESIDSRIFNAHAVLLWLDSPAAAELPPERQLEVLERAIERHQRFPFAYDRQAEILARLERWDEALDACHPKAFDGSPPFILRGRAAWVEYQRGRPERAIAMMEEILTREPDYYWGWQRLADWYEAQKRPEKFLEASEQLVRLSPRDAMAYEYRGEARRANEDSEGAKEDFRHAFEIDPDYTMAGLNLIDSQLADDELEDAGQTLETLQEHSNGPQVRLRAIQLAVRRGEQSQAMELLQEYTTDDEAAPGVIRHAAEVMDEAGWSRAVDRVFDEAIDAESSVALVGRFWVERRLNRQDHSCVDKFDKLVDRGEIGTEALIAYLDGLGNARDAGRLAAFVEKYREPLRKDTVAWGKAGWAYARINRFDQVAEWMSDWEKREKPGAWMLINLTIALRASGRDEEAARVSRHALQNAQPDPTMMYHSVWLGFDDAVAGRTAQAARLISQHDAEGEHLDSYFRLVHDMTKAMVKVQQSGRRAFADAQKIIFDSARENNDLEADPAIYRAWQKCVRRIARDTFSLRALLWKWRVCKKPPLPPLPSST
jgi:tetratricopeptide (TPR) repeat protein